MFMLASPFRATFLFAALASALVLADPGSHDRVGHRRHGFGGCALQKRFDDTRFTYFQVGENACGSYDQPSDFVRAVPSRERLNV